MKYCRKYIFFVLITPKWMTRAPATQDGRGAASAVGACKGSPGEAAASRWPRRLGWAPISGQTFSLDSVCPPQLAE